MIQKKKRASYEIDMCNGSIMNKMLLFTVPLMCSSILQLLFNAADIVVVGRFAGDNSLAAVGSTSAIVNLLVNVFTGLAIGANVLVAKYYGAKQDKDLHETIHTSILLSILSGLLLTVLGISCAKQLLHWMQTPEEVLHLAVIYLRVYFLGMVAMMLYNFGSAILRAVGDTKRPLYYLLIAGVINVVLNLIFVIVLKMDVAGVALATTISQCVSAALVIRCLMKEEGTIRLDLRKLKIYKNKFKRILQIGLPAGIQGLLFSIANVVMQSSINSFGAIVVAGGSAASNIEGFVYVSMNAFHQAAVSFTSQNMGAGKYERVNKILYVALGCVTVVGLILGNVIVLFGSQLSSIYSSNPEVIQESVRRLAIICAPYFVCGMMDVVVGVLRGMGYAIMPMLVSLVGVCGLRLLYIATIFQMERFHNISTVYVLYPISWLVTFVAHMVCFVFVRKKLKKTWS